MDLLNVPIPGLPLTVASGLLIALLALLGLALVRYLVGGWVVFLFFVAAVLAVPYWLRPRQVGPEVRVVQRPFNGLDRGQPWQGRDEEIWFFAGDFKLDLGQADLPPGETYIGLFGFAGQIDVQAPPDLGLSVSVAAFAHDAKILGERHEGVLTPIQVESDNYGSAERKVRLKVRWFAGDLDVEQG